MQSVSAASHNTVFTPAADNSAAEANAIAKASVAEQLPDTVLNKLVRVIAGASGSVNASSEAAGNNIVSFKRGEGEQLASPKLNPVRLKIAKEVHNIAHNKSRAVDIATAGLNVAYMAGMVAGKPLEGLVSSARRIEQGLSLTRRFLTGTKMNSPMRMLGGLLGIPALIVRNVGKDMYLLNGWQSAFGNAAEDSYAAAKLAGKPYKNLLDEPKALITKLGKSFGELLDPSIKKDGKWFEQSQFMALLNLTGSALLGLGLATGNHELARNGRNLQSVGVDLTKSTDDNVLRQVSGTGFIGEMAADTINDKLFEGNSTRLSSVVAWAGQVARVLGVVYQDQPDRPEVKKIYQDPIGFISKHAIPDMLKHGNPFGILSRKINVDNKFEETLGLIPKAMKAATEAVNNTVPVKLNATETKPNAESSSKTASRSHGSLYHDYVSATNTSAARSASSVGNGAKKGVEASLEIVSEKPERLLASRQLTETRENSTIEIQENASLRMPTEETQNLATSNINQATK